MMRTITGTCLALAAGLSLAAAPALAHHSSAMFDYTKERALQGTVTEFSYSNPHGYLVLGVTAASGRTQSWTIEFQSIAGMRRQGLTPASFKPGDKVAVKIHPLRNGTTGGDFVSATLANGVSITNPNPGGPGGPPA